MAFPTNIAVGLDYNDGKLMLPVNPVGAVGTPGPAGTPDPPGNTVQLDNSNGNQNSTQLIQSEDGSPEIERAEQCTALQSDIMPSPLAYSFLQGMGRGTFVSDSGGNEFRILSSKVTRLGSQKPGFSRLSFVGESISFDTPPDEFSLSAVELGINIIKNPRYYSFLQPSTNDVLANGSVINDFVTRVGIAPLSATVAQVKMAIIRAIQQYQDAPFFPSLNTINGSVQNSIIAVFISGIVPVQVNTSTFPITITGGDPNGIFACQMAAAAAQEIIQNLWYQEDTPYIPGFEMTWTQYFFSPPYLNPGCYIEDPILVVPDYFTDPNTNQQLVPNTGNHGTETPNPGIDTIFDDFATINPQYFSDDGTSTGNVLYSALRKADTFNFQRTWFQLVHTWLISPIGHWNPLLYSRNNRPTMPSQFALLQ
jgi:hypothetical protein